MGFSEAAHVGHQHAFLSTRPDQKNIKVCGHRVSDTAEDNAEVRDRLVNAVNRKLRRIIDLFFTRSLLVRIFSGADLVKSWVHPKAETDISFGGAAFHQGAHGGNGEDVHARR